MADVIVQSKEELFEDLIKDQLNKDKTDKVTNPRFIMPEIENVLALHWHPENLSIETAVKRLSKTFPNATNKLIIPTDHNIFKSYQGISGTEIDCFAKELKKKVQLLIHIKDDNLKNSFTLKTMVNYSAEFSKKFLLFFLDSLIGKSTVSNFIWEKVASEAVLDKKYYEEIRKLSKEFITLFESRKIDYFLISNSLLVNFVCNILTKYNDLIKKQAKLFLLEFKKLCYIHFDTKFFYSVEDFVEEVQWSGGAISVPHPEQFWPILLTKYKFDGIEFWNPSSASYSELILDRIIRLNKYKKEAVIPLVGDDTHFNKLVEEVSKNRIPSRDLGYQPIWKSKIIQQILKRNSLCKQKIIDLYRERLMTK